jgi:YegS/Rv2252/BmrU family lipid kinase
MNLPICILFNSLSGKGKGLNLIPKIENHLNENGFQYEVFKDNFPVSLADFFTLIIVGGDGTIQNVFNHYRDIEIPVLLIKAGTGNDFYEHLYGKNTWLEQLGKLNPYQTFKVDAGICNNRIFLNGLGIGFDGEVVKSGLGKKWFSGKAAYMSTVLSLLFTHKESDIEVKLNDKLIKGPMFMLSVANGSTYGGGFKVAPNADLQDGVLEFAWVKKISLLKRIVYLPVIEKGKHLHLPYIDYKQIEKVEISSVQNLQAHLDGEWFEANEFKVDILKRKYTLFC